jgi:hypothetical protein
MEKPVSLQTQYLHRILLQIVVFLTLSGHPVSAGTILVPGDLPTLTEAIEEAVPGDTILLAPGVYQENLHISKPLVIASGFSRTGLGSAIYETIVDGGGRTIFTVSGPLEGDKNGDENVEGEVTLIGLTIRNGEDGIMASARVNLFHNVITRCEDGIDYESGGGGIVRENVFRENEDDGIDLDGTLYHIIIENNRIFDNEDDGIEIRLHSYEGEPSFCRIANNQIYRNQEDGIQFIDYPDLTPRVYVIERNLIFDNEMAGIGCMDNGDTREDYRGAPIPEPIYLFNNTISGHEYGITGGANLISVNNLILHSRKTGAFNNTGNSVHAFCLFHGNETDTENGQADSESCMFEDPLLTPSFYPMDGSPCIDGGTAFYISGGDTLYRVPEPLIKGAQPEIGAIEYNRLNTSVTLETNSDIRIWPNPFYGELHVRTIHSAPNGSLKIIDQNGKTILSRPYTEADAILSLGFLKKGIYILVYSNQITTVARKLLKI